MERPRLGDVADGLEGRAFVGRTAALTPVDDALQGCGTTRIFHVHGPGGIGKSAVLREIARRARTAGRQVVEVHGASLELSPDQVDHAVGPVDPDGAVVLIDDVDALASLQAHLRGLVAALPGSAVVVLAGRAQPGTGWFDGPLEIVSASIALQPLTPAESRQLLELRAIDDPAQVEELVAWAAGYPLALTVAASAASTGRGATSPSNSIDGRPVDDHANLGAALLVRLGGDELADVDPDVLDVASLLPAVDARLLAATLPGHPTKAALTQLRASSVTQRHGSTVVLHKVVRSVVRERLRTTDPDRYRTLVLRAADHLRQRALTEDTRHLLTLAELVEDPSLRVGFEPSSTHYADRGTPADVERLGAGPDVAPDMLERLARYVERTPELTVAVRRSTGELSALAVVCETDRAPEWADDDPAIGPNIAHARATGRADAAVFMGNLVFAEDTSDPQVLAEVLRVGNAAIVRMVSILPRSFYVSDVERRDDGVEALGYVEVPELRRRVGDDEMFTLLHDSGPDGIIGTLYDVIRAEQGAADMVSPLSHEGQLLAGLRGYLDDETMATSPLGEGAGPERAASSRAVVRSALASSFGDDEADRTMRRALELAYLEPGGGHAAARNELHMSRSSFYRHLQRARTTLAERAGAAPGGVDVTRR